MSLVEYHSVFEEAKQQADVIGDVPPSPPLQTIISTPLCPFLFFLYISILSLLLFSILSHLPLL